MQEKAHFSFLAIGNTRESVEASEGFKRYVGIGSSYVLGVNPDKSTLKELMGYESTEEPEYIKDGDNGKEVHIHFIVQTDPDTNNGIKVTNRLMFTLRLSPAYNRDQSKVQVIDDYGNHAWVNVEDAKANKPVLLPNGNPQKIDTKYRMACIGECDLVDFLKAYLWIEDAFSYVNGTWVKKVNANDYVLKLEHIKDYFSGDFSELKEALKLMPHNKVKLLYGVRTTDEGKQYQAVASRGDLILPNAAGVKGYERVEKTLANMKQNGAYANTEFRIQELAEYIVEATNLEQPVESSKSDEFPW